MSERVTDYTNEAQQRLLKVVLALFGDVVHGMTPGALAKAVDCSAAVMTRDLFNLEKAGIAARDESTGAWRLTPRLPQQAIKVWTAIDRAERRINEAKQRYTLPAGQSAE
jgi:DNA-binding IclR family transcriptional regulator